MPHAVSCLSEQVDRHAGLLQGKVVPGVQDERCRSEHKGAAHGVLMWGHFAMEGHFGIGARTKTCGSHRV